MEDITLLNCDIIGIFPKQLEHMSCMKPVRINFGKYI
jgi:hypothetical protein